MNVLSQSGGLCVRVGGRWRMGAPWPREAYDALRNITAPGVRGLRLESAGLADGDWDTSLLVFLVGLVRPARERGLAENFVLPDGLRRLIDLAIPRQKPADAQKPPRRAGMLERTGEGICRLGAGMLDFLAFLGDVLLSVWRFFLGQAHMRGGDFVRAMYACGVQSLPIISVTSLLFGLILAFVGAVQLAQFGAQIYVAGLVGIGMLRVMGAVMVGVVMSGRIGASYAATIGSMQVNEEVDALATLGIPPVDFLVLPRVLALTLMVPLLTVYADLMGVLGGYLVGVLMLGLNPMEYWNATVDMVPFRHLLIGLVYGTVFGVVIAVAGCYQGLRCGRSAQAVGRATTTAVVQAIVGIIVSTAIITAICNVLNI